MLIGADTAAPGFSPVSPTRPKNVDAAVGKAALVTVVIGGVPETVEEANKDGVDVAGAITQTVFTLPLII